MDNLTSCNRVGYYAPEFVVKEDRDASNLSSRQSSDVAFEVYFEGDPEKVYPFAL